MDNAMKELLYLYDWYVRLTEEDSGSVYIKGVVDGISQCILNIGHQMDSATLDSFEAHKRVIQYTDTKDYWKRYPKPVSPVFPAEVIRRNGGKL